MIKTRWIASFFLMLTAALAADDPSQQRGSAIKMQSSYPAKLPPKKQPPPSPPPTPSVEPSQETPAPSNPNPQGRMYSNPGGSAMNGTEGSSIGLNEEASLCSRCQSSTAPSETTSISETPINPPERPILKKGCNLWVRAELLLWKAQEDNLTYCTTGKSPTHFEEVLEHPKPQIQWGYRLDAGYNTPHDGWDLEMQYTQIRNTGRGTSLRHGGQAVFPTLLPDDSLLLPGNIKKSKGKWKVKLNQVDFVLGREFATGGFLTLRPYAGARSTWIYQTFNTFYRYNHPHNKQDIFQKNHFWGFGFVGGLSTNWKLGWNLSLYGDVGYSLLLGFFDVGQKGKIEQSTLWNFDRSFRSGKSVLDVDLGIKWAKLFAEGDWAMAFKIGYEYHLYFSQNQFLAGRGSSGFQQTQTPGGDLAYQGVIFSGQFDF